MFTHWQYESCYDLKCLFFRVPTHPGKWEIPGNFVLHVPSREMSLRMIKIVKIWDLPWKSLLKV
jgi:hypothetical protein